MAITEIPDKKGLDKLIQRLEQQTKKLKERLKDTVDVEIIEEEKKEETPKKGEYKSFMKVASILLIIGLSAFVLMSITIPSFYDIIANVFQTINPFSNEWGVDPASPIDYVK